MITTVRIEGQEYKIGKFGLPFVWRNDEWVKTVKSVCEIRQVIKSRQARLQHDTLLR